MSHKVSRMRKTKTHLRTGAICNVSRHSPLENLKIFNQDFVLFCRVSDHIGARNALQLCLSCLCAINQYSHIPAELKQPVEDKIVQLEIAVWVKVGEFV